MRNPRLLLIGALIAVLIPLTTVSPARADVVPGEYVALGDSFASGVGAGSYDPASGDCLRSEHSYPRVWARNHPQFTLKDLTCSGATIAEVRSRQLSALSPRATLVSITVGGNDDGFSNTARACLTGTEAECEYATNLGAYYARTKLADDLTALYTDIRKAAPNARVVVMSYPRIVAEGTGSCGAATPTAANRKWMTHNADHLAEGIKDATRRAGVKFIEMRLPFIGHEACGPDAWINGVDPERLNEVFHPNQHGHAVVQTFMLWAETNT